MTFALARSLLLADAVTPRALGEALFVSAQRGTSLVRALLATRAIEPQRLEAILDRGDAPTMRHLTPVPALVQHLPPGLCERLLALPVRRDPRTGTIDVAVVDARDPHPVEEMGYWLRAPVRMVRTSLGAMDSALRRLQNKPPEGPRSLAAPIWVAPSASPPVRLEPARTPAYGSPAAKLDLEVGAPYAEAGHTDVSPEFAVADPNIPIPLTRRSLPTGTMFAPVEPVPPSAAPPSPRDDAPTERPPPMKRPSSRPPPSSDADPVLDLRRRKSMPSIPPNAPSLPFADLAPALASIRAAPDRDAILERVVSAVQGVARKVAVLALRRDMLVGWVCSAEMADPATFRTARISPSLSGVLSGALDAESATLARIPKDGTHAPLLATLKAPPAGEVGLVPVRVEGKAIALVFADEMGDTLLSTRHLEEVARAAGEALARLLRERRK